MINLNLELKNYNIISRNIIISSLFIKTIIALSLLIYEPFWATHDVFAFHEFAINNPLNFNNILNIQIGWIYQSFIGLIYKLTFPSIVLSNLISIIFWLIASIYLKKILELLKINYKIIIISLLIFSLSPSVILYTSVFLREAVIVFLINIFFFNIIKYQFNMNFKKIFFLIFLLSLLTPVHLFCIFYVPFLILSSIFFLRLSLIFQIIIALFILTYLISTDFYILKKFSSSSLNYLFNQDDHHRATYIKNEMFINEGYNYLKFILNNFSLYLFMPGHFAENFKDYIFLIERIFKTVVLAIGFIFLFLNFKNKNFYLLFYFNNFFHELLWSSVTTNWGTGSRHTITSISLVLVIFCFILNNYFYEKKNFNIYK